MKPNQDLPLGAQIKALRKSKGLTQSAFNPVGISAGYMSLIEQNLRTPSKKVLEKISSVLGINPSELIQNSVKSMSLTDLATLNQATAALELGAPNEAVSISEQLSASAKSSVAGILLECSIDIAQGNYLAASLVLEDSFNHVIHEGTFSEKIKAIGLFGEACTRLGLRLEAILKLIQIRKTIDRKIDPATFSYASLTLAVRMSEIGEFESATKLVIESQSEDSELDFKYIGWRRLWAESNIWFDRGNFEKAAECAEQAIALNTLVFGSSNQVRLRLTKFEALAMMQTNEVETEVALADLLIVKNEFAKANEQRDSPLGDFEILEAQFLFKLNRSAEASKLLERLVAGNWISAELYTRAVLLQFEISLNTDDKTELNLTFEKLMATLRTENPTQLVSNKLNELIGLAIQNSHFEIAKSLATFVSKMKEPLYNELAYLL